MRRSLVFGDTWIEAELPDDTVVMPPGLTVMALYPLKRLRHADRVALVEYPPAFNRQ